MAAVRVLISQGSRNILRRWEEDDLSQLRHEDWKTSSTLWPQSWLDNQQNRPGRPRVFLCLEEESLSQGYDLDFLKSLIDAARPCMWGADIYVVLDNEMALINPITQLEQIPRPSSQEMFDLFLDNDISDVLHWPRYAENLGEAAKRSAWRMDKISVPDPGRWWKCFVHKPPNLGPQQGAFLSPFLIRSTGDLKDENCLVVLQENRDQYMKYLKRLPSTNFSGAVMIGVIEQMGQLPEDVKEFCRENGYQLVWFHGFVELYYFLLKLNRASVIGPDLLDVAFSTRVTRPTFESLRPKLLITHSFSPTAEEDCVAAARDAWELIKELSDIAEILIYPAVHIIQLADAMDDLRDVRAWVHIGHGREDGMRQSSDDLFKSAQKWLSAFGGYKSSLSLAMFSSCRSAPVAQLFAEAGTGVAIGFKAEVAQDHCAPLTKRVVRAALKYGGSRDKILKEFVSGRNLIDVNDDTAKPVAYWSRY